MFTKFFRTILFAVLEGPTTTLGTRSAIRRIAEIGANVVATLDGFVEVALRDWTTRELAEGRMRISTLVAGLTEVAEAEPTLGRFPEMQLGRETEEAAGVVVTKAATNVFPMRLLATTSVQGVAR